MERTLSIIKPDGVEKHIIGEIYKRFEQASLAIVQAKMMHLSKFIFSDPTHLQKSTKI